MDPKHISAWMLPAAILLLSGCTHQGSTPLTGAARPTLGSSYPEGTVSAQWVPIVLKNGVVTKVGTFTLPLPIVVPAGVPMPYKMALLPVVGKPRIYSIVLFWPTASEPSMRKWATHMGRTLPLPSGAYTTKKPAAVINDPKRKLWSSWNVGHGKSIAAIIFVQGSKNPIFKQPRRFTMPGSPIRNDARCIEMQVSYNDEQFFEKNEKSGR